MEGDDDEMRFKKNQRLLNGMLLNDIKELNRTLRLHGEAHMAQDLLPQFTELVKKVEKLEGQLNFKLNDGPIHNHSVRIVSLEEWKKSLAPRLEYGANAFKSIAAQHERINRHDTRLSDLEETAEALSETVDQLSTCKCEAGNQMLKRLEKLELEIVRADTFRQNHVERIVQLERTVYNSPFSKIVMEEYAENIKQLVREVDTLKIQMHNLLPVHNNMMAEVLKQKAFLAKVQAILDRERDTRLMKSPGYLKEIEAQKQDQKPKSRLKMDANAPKDAKGQSGFSMDKHVDMMVKKGRPVRK